MTGSDDLLPPPPADLPYERIDIVGRVSAPLELGGSAHFIDTEALERFEYDDIHRVLARVPGVYVRGEDGYGLRPNIGLRGASSERSAKIALMEDGILLGPAPYSAPAAYYFPITTRMTGIEVVKGPAAVRFGPNTIGGAIDMRTRALPEGHSGDLDVAGGVDRFGKLHGAWGWGDDTWAVLLEGVHLQTDGFKELDGGGDTGFAKNELMAKARYRTDPAAAVAHRVELKVGYADEVSHETYLGLSEADFRAAPNRRYAASQLGLMDWERTQVELTYEVIGDEADLRVVLYRHNFARSWRKLNRFTRGPSLADVLAAPDTAGNAVPFAVLTGREDSDLLQPLLVGTNVRTYVSQGVATIGHWSPRWGAVDNQIEAGVRLHFDSIERTHTEDGYLMQRRMLVTDGSPTETTTRNRGSVIALAAHLHDEIGVGDLRLTPGMRLEVISRRFLDRISDAALDATDVVLIPGIGAHYQLVPWLGLLAGVHRGFSPVSPGQPDEVQPEKSVNYEAGARVAHEDTRAELIGFFNDYSNLTSECAQSTGCADNLLAEQFNGGDVNVFGLEASFGQVVKGPFGIKLSGDLSYTLTLSEFQTSFESSNPQFGDVEVGDALAYVPVHQGAVMLGAEGDRWAVNAAVRFTGQMRDEAGQGAIADGDGSDAYAVVDLAGSWQVSAPGQLYAKLDNLFDAAYVVSRRPFGARPGKPLQLLVGYKHHFGD